MLYIFDMGGVVTTTAGNSLFEEISKRLGITVNDFFDFCDKGKSSDLLAKLDDGVINAKEFWSEFQKKSGIKVSCDWFRLLFHPVLNKETYDLILKLKSTGNRVVCGTNTIDSHYDNHLSRGDYSVFDMTYTSIHMGVSKPNSEFWKLILDCENCAPEDSFFTDDKIENVEAAQKLGINAYLFDNAHNFEQFINRVLKLRYKK